MGVFAEALKLEEPPEPKSKRHELLVGLSAKVDPAGEAASLNVLYTNTAPVRVHLPMLQAFSLLYELRQLTGQMIQRQHLALDRGASHLLELCEAAPHPANVQVLVEPVTHDRLFLFQFANHPPIAVRFSAEELPLVFAQAARAIAKASH